MNRVFTMADQQAFARVSGDCNPLHMDALAARRSPAGEPVVHGVNAVLWALNAWNAPAGIRLVRLAVAFRRFIVLGRPVRLVETARRDGFAQLAVNDGDGGCLTVKLYWQDGTTEDEGDLPPPAPATAPRLLTLTQMEGLSGRLPIAAGDDPWWVGQAGAVRLLGRRGVARLAALSRLVGMDCPGRHSMFSTFDVHFAPGAGDTWLDYGVTATDSRFALVSLRVGSGPMSGEVKAFMTPAPPVLDPGRVRAAVSPGEFAGQTALIVGGSRGIGAATALVLAAGGARCLITYRDGAAEAEEVLRMAGSGRAVQLDAAWPEARMAAALADEAVSHVYYFATPKIFGKAGRGFDRDRFDRLIDVYVDGFDRVLAACRPTAAADGLRAYYPSTVAIDEMVPELLEYAMAKAAGESYCRQVADVRVVVERLPRVGTDQTASVMPAAAADPVDVALALARRLRDG